MKLLHLNRCVVQRGMKLINKKTNTLLDRRDFHRVSSDVAIPCLIRGIGHLYDSRLNKGLAFKIEERQKLGIHGMLPPKVRTQDDQIELVKYILKKLGNNVQKHLYLQDLQTQNERLYFRVIMEDLNEMVPIVYSPTNKLACEDLNIVYRRPRGIFISLYDRGHCFDILKNWPEPVSAICVTDGARIFGFGDLGAFGIGIPVAKLTMYTVAANIKPYMCLPVVIDVGTNNERFLDNNFYIGLNQKRASDSEEEELLDEFVEAAILRFGKRTVIQFEDFKTTMAYKLMNKYRDKYTVFNGDIQASGSLILAGLIAATKITKIKLHHHKILFLGASQPAIGTADLCVKAMVEEGLTYQEARDRIWLLDRDGLLIKKREELIDNTAAYAKDHAPVTDLSSAVKKLMPSILVGLSRVSGAFTPEILSDMAKFNERPVIFAMGNPCGDPECTAIEAYKHTEGRCIFASSQYFSPVTWNGKTYDVGFSNNAMIFPGIVLGAILCGLRTIKDEIFLNTSKVVADLLSDSDLEAGRVYPPFTHISKCAMEIAKSVISNAHKLDLATIKPEPQDIEAFIKEKQYSYRYEDEASVPTTYPWINLKELEEAKKTYIETGHISL